MIRSLAALWMLIGCGKPVEGCAPACGAAEVCVWAPRQNAAQCAPGCPDGGGCAGGTTCQSCLAPGECPTCRSCAAPACAAP